MIDLEIALQPATIQGAIVDEYIMLIRAGRNIDLSLVKPNIPIDVDRGRGTFKSENEIASIVAHLHPDRFTSQRDGRARAIFEGNGDIERSAAPDDEIKLARSIEIKDSGGHATKRMSKGCSRQIRSS